MGEVSSAVEAILAGVSALQSASVEELTHREIVAEMSRLTTVAWMLPSVEHRLLQRLTAETEPCRLGESSWKKVLTTALRVSGKDATRRLDKAAAALLMMIDQDGPEPSEKEPARHRSVTMGPQQRDGTRSIRGRLDAQAGAYWEAILAKEAAPGVNNPDDQSGGADDQSGGADDQSGADTGPGGRARTDIRTQAQRNRDAFTAVGRRALACGDLGTHNGLPVTVIASATLQDLEKGAGLAVTGGGSFIPIPTLIQMAAQGAHHYLYIYDQHTRESLYLGRTKRLASAPKELCCTPGSGAAPAPGAPSVATTPRSTTRSRTGRTAATPTSTTSPSAADPTTG